MDDNIDNRKFNRSGVRFAKTALIRIPTITTENKIKVHFANQPRVVSCLSGNEGDVNF